MEGLCDADTSTVTVTAAAAAVASEQGRRECVTRCRDGRGCLTDREDQ